MNCSSPRIEATEHVSSLLTERDPALSDQQREKSSFPSSQHERELEFSHLEPSTGRRKKMRRIIVKPFKLLGSAVKHALRRCFRSDLQKMEGEIFVREHIVDGKVVRTGKDHCAIEDRANETEMGKEDEEDVRQHDMESAESLKAGQPSSESAGDACESSRSSHVVDEPSSAELCREQSTVHSRASDKEGPEELGSGGSEVHPLVGKNEHETCSESSAAQSTHGSDEEENAALPGSASQSSADRQQEKENNSCGDCDAELAPADTPTPEDRNDTDLTLLGQTEAEFMEMVCSPIPFLDDEESEGVEDGEDSSTPVYSSGEESFWDSDHSSLAHSSSGDGEWDEEVVVFSRASRLLSSAQSSAVRRL